MPWSSLRVGDLVWSYHDGEWDAGEISTIKDENSYTVYHSKSKIYLKQRLAYLRPWEDGRKPDPVTCDPSSVPGSGNEPYWALVNALIDAAGDDWSSVNLMGVEEFILPAVSRHGMYLKRASAAMRNDQNVVMAAYEQNGGALRYAATGTKKKIERIILDRNISSDLFDSSVSSSLLSSKINAEDDAIVRSWLIEFGFTPHHVRRESAVRERKYTPMAYACQKGNLKVCKWLYEHGAAGDITRAEGKLGRTPMIFACQNGHLSICQWLLRMGAFDELRRTDDDGRTPMFWACWNGHLSVCQWLFDVGAAEDITTSDYNDDSPFISASREDHMSVCFWLVGKGAFNNPTFGYLDRAIVRRETPPHLNGEDRSPVLISRAAEILATHDTFLNVVLRASVVESRSQQRGGFGLRCFLPWLFRRHLQLVGLFLGVPTGRQLRNIREFKEALEYIRISSVLHIDDFWYAPHGL